MCPVISQIKGYPFEVSLPSRLPVSGVILADPVTSLDWRARNAETICTLPSRALSDILQKLGLLLSK
jgi:mRNA interferase MazF